MIKRALALAACICVIASPASAIDEVTVTQLDALPGNYRDEEVALVGEIVGDYALQATQVWIQVNTDPYAAAPLLEAGLAGTNSGIGVLIARDGFDEGWGEPGGYENRGPIVRVIGIFRYNDHTEMGESYIEAATVELIEPARPLRAASGVFPAAIGAGLILLAAFLRQVIGTRREN
ncbi:MAG: hypothetical protein OEM32_08980 [Acidimicrobiia bacterium]|nr:hypothetical protein [Acidimicrobiia bacterium]